MTAGDSTPSEVPRDGDLPGGAEDVVARIDSALAFLGADMRREVPLGPMTTYRVGGAARRFVEVTGDEQLSAIASALASARLGDRVLCVGRGSNLLVSDAGFEGLAIMLGERFAEVAIEGTSVDAGAAASLPVVARRTVSAGLSGFEWAVGVPGSMGGAVAMNAGGHGSDMAATTVGVRVHDLVSGETREMSPADLDFGYRRSAIAPHHVVSRVRMSLQPGDVEHGERLISEIVRWRRENQPGGHNAGSVFTNPPGESAGRLIDRAGCKGLRFGSAEVSAKHANFIQADPGGSADDVHHLMQEVARRVLETCGTSLHPETRTIGFQR